MLTSTFFLRRASANVQAANFIQEELDTLHTLPFAELTNRTEGNFLGLPIQRGTWSVADDLTDGQGHRLAITTTAAAIVNETGLVVVPGNYRDDFTFSAKVKPGSSSPSGWGVVLAFRYRDAENHYRIRFTAAGYALEKVYHGVKTTLWSNTSSCSTGPGGSCWDWRTIEVSASNNVITVKMNGSTLTTYTDTSNVFLTGDLVLMSVASAKIAFDDVAVTEASGTTTWNFTADAVGPLPATWQRLSWADLTGGQGLLTIENYLSETSMKKATVTIRWTDGDKIRSVSSSTVLGN
ncbi:MAG: hypothetical protein PHT12_01895 [Patescibacteria group bacterium]|nr:hypothetical protein [Patescibacteria group bacterium]